jgi:hypothetical protein
VKKAQVTSNTEINTLDKNIDIIKKMEQSEFALFQSLAWQLKLCKVHMKLETRSTLNMILSVTNSNCLVHH